MRKRTVFAGIVGFSAVVGTGRSVLAGFPAPITADPIDNNIPIATGDYSQVQTFSEPLLYDSSYDPEPDIYWFKYVSDGKTAVTFDTLGSNFGTSPYGNVLPSSNETQIGVYTSTGKVVAISRGVVDSTGNPIAIYPTFASTNNGTNWYTPEELSQVSFAPNATSDPRWDVNPNDPTPYIGWSAPGNAGNSQNYSAGAYYTNLNEYHVWSTALSKYVLGDDGSTVLRTNSGPPVTTSPIPQPGWRYGDYSNGGLASSWNQYRALPAGTYYIAVTSDGIVLSGNTYREDVLEDPINYEGNYGPAAALTEPLGTWQYYDDPNTNTFQGTIELNVTESPAAVQYQWLTDGNGNWSDSTNWAGSVPHAAGDTANFLSTNTAPRTITLDAPESVGHLVFDSAYQYTLAGSQTLTLDNGSSPADVIINTGTHVISAPLAIASNTTIIAYDSTGLSLNGSLAIGPGLTLTKLGAGSLTIGGAQNNSTSSALYVGEGTATITTDPGSNLALTSAASVTFPASTTTGIRPIHLASLSITTQGLVNGMVAFAGPGAENESNRTVLLTSAINFTGTSSLGWVGQLDLAGNDAIIHGGNLAQLTNQITSGCNVSGGGYWNGSSGITSSAAASDTTHLTALGILSNSGGIYSSFDGQSVTTTDVLIKYTYYGDANLDGKVDGSDYSRIDSGFLTHATGWSNGDFNYDGVINGSDYTLIDNAFNNQGAAITAELAASTAQVSSSSVPEPASLALLSLGSLAALSRRRRF